MLREFLDDPRGIASVEDAARLISESLRTGGKVFSCGNGGSMCDAMHFAEELTGRFRGERRALPALAISDPSHLTCVANDYGFEFVFSRYVEAFAKPGDVLVALSTSGNSPNILRAAESARRLGVKVIGLTGKGGGKLAALCDVEIRAPQSRFSDRTQEIHIKALHSIIHYIEQALSA